MAAITPPRRRIVGVSLKMYFSLAATAQYVSSCTERISTATSSNPDIDIFIIPDFLSLPAVGQAITQSASVLKLGAQDCFWEDSGAFTGEVSPAVLKTLGCWIVELGHAERRRLFNETDEQVKRKSAAAERNGIVPLVCIGEKLQDTAESAVQECWVQMEGILEATSKDVVFAYEPVWAIGQAEAASAKYVVAVTKQLRKKCEDVGAGNRTRFLYGGSAGPGTFAGMKEGVDGLFLGRFAHDIGNFEVVIREVGES
jgi:triosephosphate isomerase